MKRLLSFVVLLVTSAGFVAAQPPAETPKIGAWDKDWVKFLIDNPPPPINLVIPRTAPAEKPVVCCGGDVDEPAPAKPAVPVGLLGMVLAKQPPPAPVVFQRGHKEPDPAILAIRHTAAFARHDHRMRSLPTATPAQFDCRTFGWTTPIRNQGSCGSCWDVSACGVITDAFVKAGRAKGDGSWALSDQYVLDCGRNGGCNGDDAPTVLDMAKTKGLPTATDYGPYTARPGACKFKAGTALYQLKDWGFCTPSQEQGVAATQDIKNCLVQYGVLSTAVGANGDWDSYHGGVMPYRRNVGINHDVAIAGWDDTKVVPGTAAKGAWLVKNQWGTSWGEAGYCWIGYGSHGIGTEAAWAVVDMGPLPPPPPPPPPPPGGTTVVIDPVNKTVTVPAGWKVIGGANPVANDATAPLVTAGLNPIKLPAILADVAQIVKDVKAKAGPSVVFADAMKLIADIEAALAP